METIKVILVDDHDIVRNGIKQLLNNTEDIVVIGEASNGKEGIEVAQKLNPDVVILDIGMPIMNGVEALKEMKDKKMDFKVLVLSMFDNDDYVLSAVKNGALGYVLKDAHEDKFITAIRTVNKGKRYYGHDISGVIIDNYLNNQGKEITKGIQKNDQNSSDFDLSSREKAIMSMVSDGMSNKEIATKLDISVRTIETHRLNIMKKMKVNNVAEMVKVAFQNNILP